MHNLFDTNISINALFVIGILARTIFFMFMFFALIRRGCRIVRLRRPALNLPRCGGRRILAFLPGRRRGHTAFRLGRRLDLTIRRTPEAG